MRVPIPVVILLVLTVVGGVWWTNTRHMDFLTPPSQAKLEEIRIKVESSLPRADQVDDAISVPVIVKEPEPPPPPPEEPKPAIDLGDLSAPLTLQDYGDRSPQGAAQLIELAVALEEASEPRRALLAWERVMDLTKPDEAQAATASFLDQATPPDLARLEPEARNRHRDHAARQHREKTRKNTDTRAGSRRPGFGKSLVRHHQGEAIGHRGQNQQLGKKPRARRAVARRSRQEGKFHGGGLIHGRFPGQLRHEVLKTVFLLIQSHLGRATAYTPPTALTEAEDPLIALNSRVTRLCWSEFAAAMNQPQKIPPKP